MEFITFSSGATHYTFADYLAAACAALPGLQFNIKKSAEAASEAFRLICER